MNQNNFKHLFLLFYFLLFLCPSILSAQQSKITVTSFNRMENDITARITAPKRDQNGEICALIRIVTNEKDLMSSVVRMRWPSIRMSFMAAPLCLLCLRVVRCIH